MLSHTLSEEEKKKIEDAVLYAVWCVSLPLRYYYYSPLRMHGVIRNLFLFKYSGSSLPGGARFCTGCGTALAGSPQTAQKSPTSPTVQRSGGSPQTAVRSSPQPAKKWGSPTSSGSGID